MSVVGLLVLRLELILGVHRVRDGNRFVADERCVSGWQDLGVERLRRIGPVQGILDSNSASVISK